MRNDIIDPLVTNDENSFIRQNKDFQFYYFLLCIVSPAFQACNWVVNIKCSLCCCAGLLSVLYLWCWCSITADMLPPSLSVLQQKNWLNKYTNNFSYFTLEIENTQLTENTTTNSSEWGWVWEKYYFSANPYPDLSWQRYHNNTTYCLSLYFVKAVTENENKRGFNHLIVAALGNVRNIFSRGRYYNSISNIPPDKLWLP